MEQSATKIIMYTLRILFLREFVDRRSHVLPIKRGCCDFKSAREAQRITSPRVSAAHKKTSVYNSQFSERVL